MGCSRYKDGYNFTYESECENAALLIFDAHMKPKERIELDSSMKCGNIFSVHVSGRRLDTCFYCYEIDGLMYLDPYAKAITDCGRFGQTDEKDVYLAAIDVADYDWEDDRPLNYDYSDCIFYKMNVRGFTKSRTSKVKDKGTFSGIINKIPYLKELGITTIELQPAYEFDEIGRFPQLTDTIMSKYGAGTHYSVDKNTRKINYWGYVGGFYFAPKASYSSIASKHPGVFRDYTVEFKNVVKELHRNGIEVVMEMFFTDESTGFILQCVRHWVTEYHIDGVHVYCDESALKALSQDALLADTKIITVYWNGKTGTKKHMANYNNDFQNIARRLLKGDENMLGEFAAISRKNEANSASINYIANNNKNVLGLIDNTSFSAYLTGAYNLRGFNGGQLAGGGLLGMLIAYPVYSVFNTVGGATLLIMLELVLLLVLLRLNPAELITSMSDRRYQRHQQEQELAQQDLPPQTDAYQSAPQPPQQHPVEPLIRPQTVNYTTTSVQSDPEPSYLVPDDAPMMQPEAEPQPDPMMQRGFVPVESGVLYEEHIPVGEPYAQPAAEPAVSARRKNRRSRWSLPHSLRSRATRRSPLLLAASLINPPPRRSPMSSLRRSPRMSCLGMSAVRISRLSMIHR